MNGKEIEVVLEYESTITETIKCKSNEKIKEIFLAFCSNNRIALENVYFLINGKMVEKSEYSRSVIEFCSIFNANKLNILVYNTIDTEETEFRTIPFSNDKIDIIFWYDSRPIKI